LANFKRVFGRLVSECLDDNNALDLRTETTQTHPRSICANKKKNKKQKTTTTTYRLGYLLYRSHLKKRKEKQRETRNSIKLNQTKNTHTHTKHTSGVSSVDFVDCTTHQR